ncbi:hypothetical protein MBAV_002317 [Candidatus Magnetobacterium bavaricum]|uniref:Uncharacterized protein n=1 Tax=Candidatus Magnetobacterium bavaricum TaxID=29290 RepID=A0A0F3GUG1_9BACT|nr:hypothetical protein MBAV_002317 [Candidatus Magnetobacterium bavaricum]
MELFRCNFLHHAKSHVSLFTKSCIVTDPDKFGAALDLEGGDEPYYFHTQEVDLFLYFTGPFPYILLVKGK